MFLSYTIYYIPSRELTYPSFGKGKSSSNLPLGGDMLVPRRVYTRYIYLEPKWPVLKVNPTKQGLNSNQNKGQLGSRYIYLFEDELWSIYDVFKDDKELTRTVQKHLMAKQYVQKKNTVTKETAFIQLTRLKLTLTWLVGKPTMNEDVYYISYYSKWWFSVIMLVSIGYVYIENMFFWSKQILWTVHMTIHVTILTSKYVQVLQFPSKKTAKQKKIQNFSRIPWENSPEFHEKNHPPAPWSKSKSGKVMLATEAKLSWSKGADPNGETFWRKGKSVDSQWI